MSDCCSSIQNGACESPVRNRDSKLCPVCGEAGKPVDTQTVKALLSVSLREIGERYLFCQTQTCPVVYFSPDGQTFTGDEVRERVYQKEPDADDVFVCYCFRHSVGEFRAASPQTRQDIVDSITLGTKLNQCACEIRNPQGGCCLGNVRSVIKRLESMKELQPA